MFAVMQDAGSPAEIDQAWSVTVQTGRCGKTARQSFLLFYMMNGGSMTSARPEHLTRATVPTCCVLDSLALTQSPFQARLTETFRRHKLSLYCALYLQRACHTVAYLHKVNCPCTSVTTSTPCDVAVWLMLARQELKAHQHQEKSVSQHGALCISFKSSMI